MAADPFAHIGDLLAQLAGSLKEIRGQGAEALASDVRLVGNTSSADVAIDPSTTVTMPVVGDTTPTGDEVGSSDTMNVNAPALRAHNSEELVGLRPVQVGLRPVQVGLRPVQVGLRPVEVVERSCTNVPSETDPPNHLSPSETANDTSLLADELAHSRSMYEEEGPAPDQAASACQDALQLLLGPEAIPSVTRVDEPPTKRVDHGVGLFFSPEGFEQEESDHRPRNR